MKQYTGTSGNYKFTAQMPEDVIFARSKHVYARLNLRNAADDTPAIGVKIQGVCIVGVASFTNEYRYTDSNGDVIFDFARKMQIAMDANLNKEMSMIDYSSNIPTLWNTAIGIIRFYDTGILIQGTTHTVVNGRHDNMNDWKINTRLKRWAGYPFTMDFPNVDSVVIKGLSPAILPTMKPLKKAGSGASYQRLARYNVDNIIPPTGTWELSTADDEGFSVINGIVRPSSASVVIENDAHCNDSNKTYLRWIGRHGEVFYWLFDNITEDTSVKSELYRRTMVDDVFTDSGVARNNTRDNGIIKDISVTTTRTISTEYLDKCYYELVSSVAESPLVDMLIGSDRWQRINVADGSFSRSLKIADRAKRHRIVLTIEISEL